MAQANLLRVLRCVPLYAALLVPISPFEVNTETGVEQTSTTALLGSSFPPDDGGSNATYLTEDELFHMKFESLEACKQKVVHENKHGVRVFYCVCRRLCAGTRELSDEDKQSQRESVLEMTARHRQTHAVSLRILVAVYSLMLIVGLTGNLLVLITVARYLQHATVTNVFICSLSCADLFVIITNIPLKIWQLWDGTWRAGKVTCHGAFYLLFTAFLCSVMTLTAMSIERYLAICHPMKAQYVSTSGRAKRVVAAIWGSACILGVPAIFVTHYYDNTGVCNLILPAELRYQAFAFYLAVVAFVVPSCVMGVVYSITSVTLWQSVKTSQGLRQSVHAGDKKGLSKEAQGRIQVIRMLLAVWGVFVFCWLPLMLEILCDSFDVSLINMTLQQRNWLTRSVYCLAYSNSCLNPFLYAFLSSQFRRGFINCFLACCGRQKRHTDRMGMSSSGKTRMTVLNKHQDTSIAFSKSDLSNSEPSNASN